MHIWGVSGSELDAIQHYPVFRQKLTEEDWLLDKDSQHWRGNLDPVFWPVPPTGFTESESERGPIHFHMPFLDGVYTDRQDGTARFRRLDSPTSQELTPPMQAITRRAVR